MTRSFQLFFVFFAAMPSVVFAEEYPQPMGERAYELRGDPDQNNIGPFPGSGPNNPDKSPYAITGRCLVISDVPSTIEVPCPSLSVVLLDEKGNHVASTSISEGKFRLPASDEKSYYVTVYSKRYSLPDKNVGPVKRGDDIVLKVSKNVRP